ncbi:MAG: Rieske 2Fe-2S domain-containing protein [Actinomycetota bacterium]
MNEHIDRRAFVSKAWKGGVALIGLAGAWTSWDLLRPRRGPGGGEVRTVAADVVPEGGVVEVTAARAYLTRVGDEIVAISEKCPHLGCRVPFCEQSGQFECPCHGSVFNRLGEYREGPTPRGMDRHPVRIEDGVIFVDTARVEAGPDKGAPETIDEPRAGPSCAGEH